VIIQHLLGHSTDNSGEFQSLGSVIRGKGFSVGILSHGSYSFGCAEYDTTITVLAGEIFMKGMNCQKNETKTFKKNELIELRVLTICNASYSKETENYR